jgi:hypothetical protein
MTSYPNIPPHDMGYTLIGQFVEFPLPVGALRTIGSLS